jgi:hypothetical protein
MNRTPNTISSSSKHPRISTKMMLSAIAIASSVVALSSGASFTLPEVTAHDGFPKYADLTQATKYQTKDTLKTTVTAESRIPKTPDTFLRSVLVYGYGWVDTDTGKAFTTLIHPNFRDSTKNPDKWHGHPVTLTTGTANSDFCVPYIGDAGNTAEGGISIDDETRIMKTSTSLAKLNGLKTADIDTAASFIVQEDSDCPGIEKYINGGYTIANLGVVVHDTVNAKAVSSG